MPTNVHFACKGTDVLVRLGLFACLDQDLCSEAIKVFLDGRLHFFGLAFHFGQFPLRKANAKWMKDTIILICSLIPTS